jgi:hypothetical protein
MILDFAARSIRLARHADARGEGEPARPAVRAPGSRS